MLLQHGASIYSVFRFALVGVLHQQETKIPMLNDANMGIA
jgi:hypothetical protein